MNMKKNELPAEFVHQCERVKAKRPRTVIAHILEHGYITTEELKEIYGYNHPPRAARDVREQGIPLITERITGADGRKIAAYTFGNPADARFQKLRGRTAFSKKLKETLLRDQGCRCAFYMENFDESQLQIDHRIPFEIAGDHSDNINNQADYMLVCGSANRAKSWSCEHCVNWTEIRNPDICKNCYWAYPEKYNHIAMRPIRRADIIWTDEEIEIYEKLKNRALELQKDISSYIKELLIKALQTV